MEIRKKSFLLGFLACLFIVGCAGFSYPFYGLDKVNYELGVLLGPEPKDDLPFAKCTPSLTTKNPCVVMFSKDFFALKQDFEDTQQKLKECEKGK